MKYLVLRNIHNDGVPFEACMTDRDQWQVTKQ